MTLFAQAAQAMQSDPSLTMLGLVALLVGAIVGLVKVVPDAISKMRAVKPANGTGNNGGKLSKDHEKRLGAIEADVSKVKDDVAEIKTDVAVIVTHIEYLKDSE